MLRHAKTGLKALGVVSLVLLSYAVLHFSLVWLFPMVYPLWPHYRAQYLLFIGMVLLGVIVIPVYFLPAIIGRKQRNAWAIFVLNLLLGWTLIGWVAALVWARRAEPAGR